MPLELDRDARTGAGPGEAPDEQCELRREGGRLQIVERFEWGGGRGTHVIQELLESERASAP